MQFNLFLSAETIQTGISKAYDYHNLYLYLNVIQIFVFKW